MQEKGLNEFPFESEINQKGWADDHSTQSEQSWTDVGHEVTWIAMLSLISDGDHASRFGCLLTVFKSISYFTAGIFYSSSFVLNLSRQFAAHITWNSVNQTLAPVLKCLNTSWPVQTDTTHLFFENYLSIRLSNVAHKVFFTCKSENTNHDVLGCCLRVCFVSLRKFPTL